MDDGQLLAQTYEGNRSFFAAVAERVLIGPGYSAAIVPVCPDRSVVNCVSYRDAAALERALPEVADEYDRAGVRAWTVWVPAADRAAAELLAAAGHKLDGAPEAMGTSLAAVPEAEAAEEAADSSLVGPINDAAYGLDGSFTAALAPGLDHPGMRVYLSGREASVVTLDVGSDCHVGLVATVPDAQRRGLAGRLLAGALAAARERGQRTTTLIASGAGRPVYERLGYRPLGAIEMWERRAGA